MYDNVITLISESVTVNEYGDRETVTTEKLVFADFRSITQTEFYQAEAVGLKPEIKFVLPDYLEYNNQRRIKAQMFGESEEKDYTVLRTYRNNNELEIVCKRGID